MIFVSPSGCSCSSYDPQCKKTNQKQKMVLSALQLSVTIVWNSFPAIQRLHGSQNVTREQIPSKGFKT